MRRARVARTTLVIDTSALVSLGVADLLDKTLEVGDLVIPEEVKDELVEMGTYPDEEGKAAKRALALVKSGAVRVARVEAESVERHLSASVDRGEAACFACCIEHRIGMLVCDDVNASCDLESPAKTQGIRIKISAAIVAELARAGRLSRGQALAAVKRMARIREWEGGVLEYLAEKHLKEI